YRADKVPAPLRVDLPSGVPGGVWNKLEENSMGEFGWKEVLKQYSDEESAKKVAAVWDGDDYVTFENKETRALLLFTRIRLNDQDGASRFFQAYSAALKRKYPRGKVVSEDRSDLEISTPSGAVSLRCEKNECISMEGGTHDLVLQWIKK